MKTSRKFRLGLVLALLFSIEVVSLGFMFANPASPSFDKDPDSPIISLEKEVRNLKSEAMILNYKIKWLNARNQFLSSFPYTHTKIEISQNNKLLRYNKLLLGRIEDRVEKKLILIKSIEEK